MTSGRLAALSVLVAVGSIAAYVLLFRVAAVRNHPEGYVVGFAAATASPVSRPRRPGSRPTPTRRARRWPSGCASGTGSWRTATWL